MSRTDELAEALWRAEASREPIAPISAAEPTLDLDGAYAVQAVNTARRLAAGERIVGRKIGLTSKAMQQQLGVDQPDVGAITDRMVIPSGGVLAAAELIAPRIEAEIAFRLARDLPPGEPSPEQLRAAIGEVCLAAEIIDSRIADWRIGLIDTVADNASSARIVVGQGVAATPQVLDSLADLEVRLVGDGEVAAAGFGRAVLDHPLHAIAWLARTLARRDDGLRAGQVVLAGAVHASVALTAAGFWTVEADGLPSASLRIA